MNIQRFCLITLFALVSLAFPAYGQWSMHVTVGVSPQQTPASNHIIVNASSPRDEFTFDLARVQSSPVAGVGTRYSIGSFFMAAETQYSKREYVYDVHYTYPGFPRSPQQEEYHDAMHIISLPVSVGVDLGVVDVTSGFVPHGIISQHSEMEQVSQYEQQLKRWSLGWQSGIAAKVSNLRLGLVWQMDFQNYATHARIAGQPLTLEGNPSRMIGTISYQF